MKTQPIDFRADEGQEQTKPAYAYVLKHGEDFYYLTSHDLAVTIAGLPAQLGDDPQQFISAQISHGSHEQSIETNSPEKSVSIATQQTSESNELRKFFLVAKTKRTYITIIRINTEALPDGVVWDDNCYVEFYGEMTDVTFSGYTITLSFVSVLKREEPIPRYTYQKTCQHELGRIGAGFCNVNLEQSQFRVATSVAAVQRSKKAIDITATMFNGNPITAKTFENGKLVELNGDGGVENEIWIVSTEVLPASAGVRFRLLFMPTTLQVGTSIKLYVGCDRTIGVCQDTFGNLPNFGGMPYIPKKNPALDGIDT